MALTRKEKGNRAFCVQVDKLSLKLADAVTSMNLNLGTTITLVGCKLLAQSLKTSKEYVVIC